MSGWEALTALGYLGMVVGAAGVLFIAALCITADCMRIRERRRR